MVAVAHLHVTDAGQTLSSLHTEAQKSHKRLARLLVRQGQNGLLQVCTACIHVAPLTGLERHVIVHDTCALGFKARWQVGQSACVDQLTQSRGGGGCQIANQMQEAQAIGSGALYQQVMDVIFLALMDGAALNPVAAHTNHLTRNLVQGNDVGQFDACGFAVFIRVFKPGQIVVKLELQQIDFFLFPALAHTRELVFFFLDLGRRRGFFWLCHIQILTIDYRFAEVVGGHRHTVGDSLTTAHD